MTRPLIDLLEPRRLMSIVADLRLPGGGKTVHATTAGQTIQLELWARVTGADADLTNDAVQHIHGSFLSSAGGSVFGNMSAVRVAPFTANGSTDPVQADLDGDGDLDAGSNTVSSATGFFLARSGTMTFGGTPAAGGGVEWKVADVTFTVTQLLGGATTELNFRPRKYNLNGSIWIEDGVPYHTQLGSYEAGSPVVVTSTGGPVLGAISGSVYDDLDADGTRDAGEPTLPNWGVYLDANKNGLRETGETRVDTDSNGNYVFPALPAGSYRVRELLYPGYRRVTPSSGFYDVSLATAQFKSGYVFGNTKKALISGQVFKDTNGNGLRDAGETGLSGRVVFDDLNQNGRLDTGETRTTTNSSGNYLLNVSAGWHYIRVVPTSGYRATTASYLKILVGDSTRVYDKLFGQKPI